MQLLEAGNPAQALLLFQQCETTLEYAAGCGKTIDRNLILTVLNNEAAAYQRSQQPGRAASYVEAIIYNLNLFLDSQTSRLLLTRLADATTANPTQSTLASDLRTHCEEDKSSCWLTEAETEGLHAYAARKYDCALYLLQFAGLQSQIMAHEDSLANARRALLAVKDLARISLQYETLRGDCEGKALAMLEELTGLPVMVEAGEYEGLRRELERAARGQGVESPLEGSLIGGASFEEVFALRGRGVRGSVGPGTACRAHPLRGEHARQAGLVAVCAYFTMGAELEEMSGRQSSVYLAGEGHREGECYHLQALIAGHRLLPPGSKFVQ